MPDSRWSQLAGLAQRQHGLVSGSQISALGYSEQELRTILSKGLLTRVERGLFTLVGHQPDWRTTLLAHCFATHGRAFATSAAMLHSLGKPADLTPGYAEVLAPVSVRRRSRARLTTHHGRQWDRVRTIEVQRIPTIPVAETIISLAQHHSFETFRSAANAARRGRRTTIEQIEIAAEPFIANGVRHAPRVRDAIDRLRGEPVLSLSDWSDQFADWCLEVGLPAPKLEYRIVDHDGVLIAQVDLCWPEFRVVVELDSWAWHHDRSSFDKDRLRYRRLTVAGWTVLAITWSQWTGDRMGVAKDLASALGRPLDLPALTRIDRTEHTR